MKDAHVTLQGVYSLDTLNTYVDAAIQAGLDEITIVEPTYLFQECSSLYHEVIASYSYQKEWFSSVCTSSIVAYQRFIQEMRTLQFPIKINFGLEVSYEPQHEAWIQQMKEAFSYDVVVGAIHFVDHIAFDWPLYSKKMLWDKYHAGFLYRRYYELMNALITSNLFDGVAKFDSIKALQVPCRMSFQHTYHKLATLLAKHHMYVEQDQGLSPIFLEICKTMQVEVVMVNLARNPEEIK